MNGVLCAGSIVYDTIVRAFTKPAWGTTEFVDSIEYRVGGNAANTSRALGILGTPVRLLGTLGADTPSIFIRKQLADAGVEITFLCESQFPTAATVVLVNENGDRQFLHRKGASEEAFCGAIDFNASLCEGMQHFHLASLFVIPHLRSGGPVILQHARAKGLTTSFDTNWDPQGEWLKALQPCLPYLDFLFMNEDEARMVAGTDDPDVIGAAMLTYGVRTVVLKLGGAGCAIYTEQETVRCPAYDVIAKDTTGAGDCFVAGFLDAYLRGEDFRASGQFANAVAALSVQQIGAVEGIRRRDAVAEWAHHAPVREAKR
ncbi:MAG: carbohydrate kinase family protein [Acidobacteria bacterium]|nr:carbohydrate kinase family protein [Acidobacteriota bacterium]